MRATLFLNGLLLFAVMITTSAQDNLKNILPIERNGWTILSDKVFNPDDLYDYINGGAELYISYGFTHVVSRTYSKPGFEDITVEIFDMLEPENAYGVFTQQREEEVSEPGQGAQIMPGSIIFWKDRYFVSLMNHREIPEVKEAMHNLAFTIATNIGHEGKIPDVINQIPAKNLDSTTIKFFKHYIWLNSYNFISSENIFNISDQTDAVLAKYAAENGNRTIVLLIDYPTPTEQNEAWKQVAGAFSFDPSVLSQVIKDDENNYWGFAQKNNMIFGVFNLPSQKAAINKLKELHKYHPK